MLLISFGIHYMLSIVKLQILNVYIIQIFKFHVDLTYVQVIVVK